MAADLVFIVVMYVYDIDFSFDTFFVAAIVVFIIMKFIFFLFPFIFRFSDLTARLIWISGSVFAIFEALSSIFGSIARLVTCYVAWIVWEPIMAVSKLCEALTKPDFFAIGILKTFC